MKKFCPVSTKTLMEIIESSSSVEAEVKKETIDYFTEKGIFDEETVGSLELGIILGKMLQEKSTDFVESFSPLFDELRDTSKLPILS